MLKIICILVVQALQMPCYSLSVSHEKQDLRHNERSHHKENPHYLISQVTFIPKSRILRSLETQSTYDSQNIWRSGSQSTLRRLNASYKTVNNFQESENQSTEGDFARNNQNANKNAIGLNKSVRFFRRNNHWKPKRLIPFNTENSNKKHFQKDDHQTLKTRFVNFEHQNTVGSEVSDCCNVVSNTIIIRNSGSKVVNDFKAPDFLPPIEKVTPKYEAPEYLPPNTEIKNVPNIITTTTASYRLIERGDVPDEDDFDISATTVSVSAPDDSPSVITTSVSASKKTFTTPSNTEETRSSLNTSPVPSIGLEYLPPKATTSPTVATTSHRAAPAMAMLVPPEPEDIPTTSSPTDDLSIITSISPTTSLLTTTEDLIPEEPLKTTPKVPDTNSFKAPEYIPPKEPQPESGPAMAVTPKSENSTISKGSDIPSSTPPVLLDTNPLKPPEYIPPKEPELATPEPAMAMLVPPEPEDNPSSPPPISTTNDFRSDEPLNTTIMIPDDTKSVKAEMKPSSPAPDSKDLPTTSISTTDDLKPGDPDNTTKIPDSNIFKAPEYLPSKEMVPKPDCNVDPHDNPDIDPRSFVGDNPLQK